MYGRVMFKILHLFRIEKFTEGYIKFINDNFDNQDHDFWIYGRNGYGRETKFSDYKNVKYVRNVDKFINPNNLEKYDKIIYHGVFEQNIINSFYKNKSLLSKTYLYFWGGDIYLNDEKENNIKKKYIVDNAHAIINIFPEEKKQMKKIYDIKGKMYTAFYYSKKINMLLEKYRKEILNEKKYVAIQIGNSATKSNNHLFVLRKIKRYKNENIKLIVPLSYGDEEYAKKVIKYGKKVYGEKFVPITKLMNEEQYYNLISNIDVGIFDIRRQQATGNINALLYYGKKVFLIRNSILADFYIKRLGCVIDYIDEINYMNFEQFIHISTNERINNYLKMRKLHSTNYRKRLWEKIFLD